MNGQQDARGAREESARGDHVPRHGMRLWTLLVCLLAGCAGEMPAQIRGTAAYERTTLPPGALLEATLEDVSRAGAKAEVIATRASGSRAIRRSRSSSLRSRTLIDPKRALRGARADHASTAGCMFVTDQHYPHWTTYEVALTLRRVGALAQKSDEPLESTTGS